jgi:hypothetical protein
VAKKRKKRLSGAQWRKRQRQGLTSNRRGPAANRERQLYLDIAHELWLDPDFPNWSDGSPLTMTGDEVVSWLLSPRGALARGRLMDTLRERWPERYATLNDATLSRYIGAVIHRMWNPRGKRGAKSMQKHSRR